MPSHSSILVVGAGYAGVLAAVRVARQTRGRATVRLLSPTDFIVERVRLHESVATGRNVEVPIAPMLSAAGVQWVRGIATNVDADRRVLHTDDRPLSFDWLIFAAGSGTRGDAVPGVADHAFTMNPSSVPALRARLCDIESQRGRVVICGAGLTGIELATELAEARPGLRVAIVCGGSVAPMLSERAQAHVRTAFRDLGVTLHEDRQIERVGPDGVQTSDGAVPGDVVIWCGGFAASPVLNSSGLATDATGRAWVDPQMRAVGHERVFVVGDAARPMATPGHAIHMGCKTAMPMGAHAADNVARAIRGLALRPFDFRDNGYCVSLGRHRAVVEWLPRDGRPMGRVITGRWGVWIKEAITRYTVASLRAESRGWLHYRWLHTGRAPHTLTGDAAAMLPPPNTIAR